MTKAQLAKRAEKEEKKKQKERAAAMKLKKQRYYRHTRTLCIYMYTQAEIVVKIYSNLTLLVPSPRFHLTLAIP